MTEPAPEQRRRGPGIGTALLTGAVIFALLIVGLIVWGVRSIADAVPTVGDISAALEPEPYEEIGPTVVRSIRDLANLTTVELVEYTIVEKGTDGGFLAWARGDSLQLFAVARIGAGVDLSEVTVRSFELSEDGVVELVVPRATIQYVAVDNEATQILDRETGIFTKGDPRLETDARRVADETLRQAALDSGILEMAEENAEEVISNFLLSLGYRDVIIEFE
ncbi:MAG TPA: DUF4230 domain-containing protein [Acidimicrobiia bacterium]